MGKERESHRNPELFLPEDSDSIASSTKTRRKASKQHQKQQKMISSGMSSKILKQVLIQQKEIQAEERNPNLNALEEKLPEPEGEEYDEDQIDDFSGFSET